MSSISKRLIFKIFQYSNIKKINLIYFLATLSIVVIIFIFIFIYIKGRSRLEYGSQTQFENSKIVSEVEYLRNIKMKRDSNELFSENIQLDDIYIVSPNNELLKLKSRINEPKLVYRFSSHSCRACVENDIKILKILSDTIGLDKIIILTNFQSIKFLKIYKKNENLPFDCYNFSEAINIPIERNSINDSPYFFVLNNDLKVDFAYTSCPEHTINSLYFKRIRMFFK
ncbi:MAG: hypothetical protein AB2L20_30715 [Mangrovibacterium sp.]